MRRIEPDRIARAARIYATNQEASQALGIAPGSFSRLCRTYGIETPHARKRRRRRESRNQPVVRQRPREGLPVSLLLRLGLDPDEAQAAAAELESVR